MSYMTGLKTEGVLSASYSEPDLRGGGGGGEGTRINTAGLKFDNAVLMQRVLDIDSVVDKGNHYLGMLWMQESACLCWFWKWLYMHCRRLFFFCRLKYWFVREGYQLKQEMCFISIPNTAGTERLHQINFK